MIAGQCQETMASCSEVNPKIKPKMTPTLSTKIGSNDKSCFMVIKRRQNNKIQCEKVDQNIVPSLKESQDYFLLIPPQKKMAQKEKKTVEKMANN